MVTYGTGQAKGTLGGGKGTVHFRTQDKYKKGKWLSWFFWGGGWGFSVGSVRVFGDAAPFRCLVRWAPGARFLASGRDAAEKTGGAYV